MYAACISKLTANQYDLEHSTLSLIFSSMLSRMAVAADFCSVFLVVSHFAALFSIVVAMHCNHRIE